MTKPTTSRVVEIALDCPYETAYDYLVEPANFKDWADGLGAMKKQADGTWRADSPQGAATLRFTPRNAEGVLDHFIKPEGGEEFSVAMRLIRDGRACKLALTLQRQPSMSDAAFDGDAASVQKDFAVLKKILEKRAPGESR